MKLRGHGGTIAIALAALAVVIASTGAAVAVAATKVNIVDATTPSRAAKVDPYGQLLVTGATARISSSGLLVGYQGLDNFVTSPTTATLGISKLQLSESVANAGASGSSLRAYLYKVGVDSAGNCASTGYVQLGLYQFGPGDTVVDPFPAPLVVKATGGQKYCLDLYVVQLGTSGNLSYFPSYVLTATVLSGSYTGLGAPAAGAAGAPASAQLLGGDVAP